MPAEKKALSYMMMMFKYTPAAAITASSVVKCARCFFMFGNRWKSECARSEEYGM